MKAVEQADRFFFFVSRQSRGLFFLGVYVFQKKFFACCSINRNHGSVILVFLILTFLF